MTFASEKDTDYYLQTEFVKVFDRKYNTGTNKELFKSLKPDGWFYLNESTLLIIENKQNISSNDKAKQQVINYANTSYVNSPTIELIICINGFGTNNDDFTYLIYEYTRANELILSNIKTINELHELYGDSNTSNSNSNNGNNNIEEVNLQSLHNLIVKQTNINSSRDLSLFTGFCLLSCKLPSIRQILAETNNNVVLLSTLALEFQKFYSADIIDQFPNKTHLMNINLKPILNNVSRLPQTSLNNLYKQFCKYTKLKQDKNIELTPQYITYVMQNYVDMYYGGYKTVIDPFSGTSSLLIGLKSNSSRKIAIEITPYMYLMSKINLEINNVKNYELINDDMLHVKNTIEADVCITNPPYTKKLSGKHAIEWLCELIGKVNVIIAIIPTSNISNKSEYNKFKKRLIDNGYYLRYVINCGKCFKDVNVEASIIVVDNYEDKSSYHLFDLNFVNKRDYIRPPLKDIIITQHGNEKIQNIIDDINYIEIDANDYDETTDWSCSPNNDLNEISNWYKKDYTNELLVSIQRFLNNESTQDDMKRFNNVFESIRNNMNIELSYMMNGDKLEQIRIGNLFRAVRKNNNHNYSTSNLQQYKDETYDVPMFACKKLDNGIAGYVENEEYEGNVIVVVKSRNATCGYAFHYEGKLAWSNFNLVIERLDNVDLSNKQLDEIAKHMTIQLAPNHLDKEAFNMNELLDKTLMLPIGLIRSNDSD